VLKTNHPLRLQSKYQTPQKRIALLKILALSGKEIKEGKYRPLEKSFSDVRKRINDLKKGRR